MMASAVARSAKQKIEVIAANPEVGAEIVGVDLSKPLDDETFAVIRDAYYKHSVIVFRGQKITEQQQIDFSRRFGNLEIHVLKQFLHPQHPEILLISNIVENGKNIGIVDAGRYWHSDLCYKAVPSMGSTLYSIEVPRDDNGKILGDTLFASVACSYDALPEKLKQRVAGLKALNSLEHTFDRTRKDADIRTEQVDTPEAERTRVAEEQKKLVEAIHPVVRTHPVTGRKCIFVNDSTTVKVLGVSDSESEDILGELRTRCIRQDFIFRHKWQVGDVLMWDKIGRAHV